MALIPNEVINEVLQKANIVEIISGYLPLTKNGKNYLAPCPFHDDTKPSLTISPEKQIFTCFVCGEKGNAITFVQKYEHVSFPEAVKIVADKVGVALELPKRDVQQNIPDEIKRAQMLLKEVENFSSYQLSMNQEALEYISSRIDEKTIQNFNVGYIPNSEELLTFLLAKGFSEQEIYSTGVISADKNYTFMNQRITFPIHDRWGNTVGFSARTMDATSSAKYINSSESDVFSKGKILFNLDKAIPEARKIGYINLMEGHMDVIKADEIGVHNCVALMGTALSEDHVKQLRYLKLLVNIALDGDNPGISATLKNYYLLRDAGIECKFTYFGKDMDPDDLIKMDKALFIEKINNPINIMEYRLQLPHDLNSFEALERFTVNYLKDLVALKNPLAEDFYIKKLSERTGFDSSSIKQRLETLRPVDKKQDIKVKKDVGKAKKMHHRSDASKWDNKKVKINLKIKEKLQYKDEMNNNYDRLSTDSKVIAFTKDQVLDRKGLLSQYVNQKGKVLETTITLLTTDNISEKSQAVAQAAAIQIAKEVGIPKSNLEYVAFLHLDTKYPHIHLQCYQRETYLDNYSLTTSLVESLSKEIVQELNNTNTVSLDETVQPIRI